MARILCVCPDCWDVYWQDGVPADFAGRCRKPSPHMTGLKALCDMADKVGGKHGVYYPMKCSECIARATGGSYCDTVRRQLALNEQKTGTKQEIRG